MAMIFDDTGYFLFPPLTKEQMDKMRNLLERTKKFNSHWTITFSKHEPKVIESIAQIIKSKEDEIFKRANGTD